MTFWRTGHIWGSDRPNQMIDSANLQGPGMFFESFVLPNYREFLTDPLSVRRAYNAAVSIAHVPDHIVIREGGKASVVGNLRKDFRNQSRPFKIVDAMCNAIKHVHATGGGADQPIVATSTGMTAADPDRVLFVSEVDGALQEYRPVEPLLVFDIFDSGSRQPMWVGWTLYLALRFVANKLGRELDIKQGDLPPQANFVYRLAK